MKIKWSASASSFGTLHGELEIHNTLTESEINAAVNDAVFNEVGTITWSWEEV
jgi:pantothenate kinase